MSKSRWSTVTWLIVPCVLLLAVASGAGAQQTATDPLLQELKQLAPTRAQPKPPPRAPGKPNRRGKSPKTKSAKVGTKGANRGSAPRPRRANELNWDGWPNNQLPQVGQIWAVEQGATTIEPRCSGTVFARGVVVTAAHCVVNAFTKDANGLHPYHTRILFVPGQTWNDPNSLDVGDIRAPWGVWEANNWWAPSCYRNDSCRQDWGLIEITPKNGKYIGDVVGSWRIQTGITFNVGARIWAGGYPGMGFWHTQRGYAGRGQYACDSTWDGAWRSDGGTELWIQCPMNGGASGGPWLVQLNSGEWVIGGVNNWCYDEIKYDDEPGTYCTPTSQYIRSLIFDGRFLTFWNSVVPQLRY